MVTSQQNFKSALGSPQSLRLPRTMSVPETWGFGFSGHLTWLSTAPILHAALGCQAMLVLVPSVIIGMILNLQVKRLGEHWPQMSGGRANYTTRLLKRYPNLGRYAALGYFFSWSGFIPINSFVLTDLLKVQLEPLGITCPETLLHIGFTVIAFVLAFSGTRALSILHLCFIIPVMGLLFAFCVEGFFWLTFAADSPGIFPSSWMLENGSSLNIIDWLKWFFFCTYSLYSCETAASFVADSRNPQSTLKFLGFATWIIPVVYLGCSWILMRLATDSGLGESSFLNLQAAAFPFWGNATSVFITFLLVSASLLGSATAVANSPRILYQLSLDGFITPLFAVVSRQGVLIPGLILTLFVSLVCLVWGDVPSIVVGTNASWLASAMATHWGLWLQRKRKWVKWSYFSLFFLLLEIFVLGVGGWAWGWRDLLTGLIFPILILVTIIAVRNLPFAAFNPNWWRRRQRRNPISEDFLAFQVFILIFLVCGSATISWLLRNHLETLPQHVSHDLLVVLLLIITFVGIAIACWTSLPQIAAVAEAREHAEHLFVTALDTVPDTILVIDGQASICQANPAAELLLETESNNLIGRCFSDFIVDLAPNPIHWLSVSEQKLFHSKSGERTIEITISPRSHSQLQNYQEYIVIMRDITQRKQAEIALKTQATQLQQTLKDLKATQSQLVQTEKMSSLGQLVAGIAHEINNPVNFIYGNLTHVKEYAHNLIDLLNLYQKHQPPVPEVQEEMEEIDFDYIIEDFPKTLSSMKIGADRIREIVLTLRNFSRLDEVGMKAVDIHEGIDSTLVILQNRLRGNSESPQIKIIKEYSCLPKVECYAGQLNQVFLNIISNAIDALQSCQSQEQLEHNSKITIKTQILEPKAIRISIKDNGKGINPSIKERIFDPFFTTKEVGKGTGLGLSISYQIVVDKHKGKIKCISEPEQGTEFQIEIPIKQKYHL